MSLGVHQPITQSEYQQRVDAGRAEWVPVAELADYLVSLEWDWSADQVEEAEDRGPLVKEDAWDQAVKVEEKRLRDMVRRKELKGK